MDIFKACLKKKLWAGWYQRPISMISFEMRCQVWWRNFGEARTLSSAIPSVYFRIPQSFSFPSRYKVGCIKKREKKWWKRRSKIICEWKYVQGCVIGTLLQDYLLPNWFIYAEESGPHREKYTHSIVTSTHTLLFFTYNKDWKKKNTF